MSLSEICIKRPVFATVLSLIIIVLGLVFVQKLQIQELPDINLPIITIVAEYEGASPLYMEQNVTNRIEKALKSVKNIDFLTSQSSSGQSLIIVHFTLSTDIEVALNDIRSKIVDINSMLPIDMKSPTIFKADNDTSPSLWITVNSNQHDAFALTRITEERIKTALSRLGSVGEVKIYGAQVYTMHIEPDYIKMYQYKITPLDIANAINAQNKDYPVGVIKTGMRNFTVKINGKLNSPEDFNNIVLRSTNDNLLKLRDIAKVHLGLNDNETLLRYNGNKSIAVGLIKHSKSNVVALSHEAREALSYISTILPTSVALNIAYDSAIQVKASINAVFWAIIESLILVIIVVYLFLSSTKITLIPFVTIPISLIGTFTVMYFFGFSINTFTLLALVLAIGLVVDDAIVMLENIFRHHQLGKPIMEAAISGSKEINFVIIAMTITLAAVFLPVGFIEGFIGKLFIEFAWTLAFCVLLSGFIALTLTPMMASKMIDDKNHKQIPPLLMQFNEYLLYVQDRYTHYLNFTINNKKYLFWAIAISTIILVTGFTFITKLLTPKEDMGYLQVVFTGPEGSSAKQSEKTIIEAERIIMSYKDILACISVVWGDGDNGFAFVPLKDWSIRTKSQNTIAQELNKQFAQIPGMSIFTIQPQGIRGGNSDKTVAFSLQTSSDYSILDRISKQFQEKMEQSLIFEDIGRDIQSSVPMLDIIVNRDKAYLYKLNMENIGTTIKYLIAGMRVSDFMIGNDVYDVILRYDINHRNKISDLSMILMRDNNNNMIPLDVVAKIDEKIGIKSYNHYNNAKSITVSANLAQNKKLSDAINFIDDIAGKLLDNETNLEYLGEIKQMRESQYSSAATFLLALIFIYLVLCAQFESFTDPLLILASVPFSITGGVLALWISGNSINMYSNIGLITLIGLITKNAIMIVEFANQIKPTCSSPREAVVKAAQIRLRPILMTSLATICGSMPLVFASGAGSAARNSIGLVIVGGMIIGTLFTMFVIPVLYQTFKRA